MIRKTMEECRPTPAEIRRVAALAARPDSEIDLSDIPELPEDAWKNAKPNPFYAKLAKSGAKPKQSK